VFEFDSKVKEGFISEDAAYDDYFTFDNLEAEREKLKAISEKSILLRIQHKRA